MKFVVVGIAGLTLDAEAVMMKPAGIDSGRVARVVVRADIGRAIVVPRVRVDRMGRVAEASIGIHHCIVVAASHKGRLSSSSHRQVR
jgi:hypothetical protein